MIIGITGSRDGMTLIQQQTFETIINKNIHLIEEIHHGDCNGVDSIVHHLYSGTIKMIVHPPTINTCRAYCQSDFIMPPLPYLDRNKQIVNNCNVIIAVPNTMTEVIRSGTWSTIRYAKKCKKTYLIIYPDGNVLIDHQEQEIII
jgi:hypothetical protein